MQLLEDDELITVARAGWSDDPARRRAPLRPGVAHAGPPPSSTSTPTSAARVPTTAPWKPSTPRRVPDGRRWLPGLDPDPEAHGNPVAVCFGRGTRAARVLQRHQRPDPSRCWRGSTSLAGGCRTARARPAPGRWHP